MMVMYDDARDANEVKEKEQEQQQQKERTRMGCDFLCHTPDNRPATRKVMLSTFFTGGVDLYLCDECHEKLDPDKRFKWELLQKQ